MDDYLTTPAANSTNIFNAISETGAALGNTFLIGNGNPTSYPVRLSHRTILWDHQQ